MTVSHKVVASRRTVVEDARNPDVQAVMERLKPYYATAIYGVASEYIPEALIIHGLKDEDGKTVPILSISYLDRPPGISVMALMQVQ